MPSTSPALLVIDRHRAALIDYARRIVGSDAAAEDVIQSLCLALAEQPATTIRNDIAYLRRAVRNAAIDQLRRTAREQRIGAPDPRLAATVADGAPSAETALIARDQLACVRATIEAMPDRQKTAILLYRLDGLKLREIAERLGVSIPLVHSLIADGIALCAHRCGKPR